MVELAPAALSRHADGDVRGIVFDIQRCALQDGPGIRTTVFLKGCPLRCIWCHNPESQAFEPELAFRKERRSSVDQWHLGPVETIGREMTVEDVLLVASRDAPFYDRSGGGITISGGEPMARFGFTAALLKAARRLGIHTCLDTCGYARKSSFEEIYSDVDLFLYDFKESDPERHRELTGVSNKLILENLDVLYRHGARIILRCPLVPGVNDTETHLQGIAELSGRYPDLAGVEILPYHNMGSHKASWIGRQPTLPHLGRTDEDTVRRWIEALWEYGCTRATRA